MYIRTHEDIKTDADFRNLIMSVILRQKKTFREDDVFSIIIKYFNGSPYYEELKMIHNYENYHKGLLVCPNRETYIRQKISDTLDLLSRNRILRRCREFWYPQSI